MFRQDNRASRGSTDPAFPVLVADVLSRWRPSRDGQALSRLGQPERRLPLTIGGMIRASATSGHAINRRTAQRLLDELLAIVEAVAAAVAAEPEEWLRDATWLDETGRRADGWALAAGRPVDPVFADDAIRPTLRRGVAA